MSTGHRDRDESSRQAPTPPHRAERLIDRVLPSQVAAAGVVGDLREEFEVRARSSVSEARRWYWRQAVAIWARYRWESVVARLTALPSRMDGVRLDALAAARGLRRAPSFTLTAALTLAIGVGSSALVFGLVHGILLRPLPLPDPDRVVVVWPEEWFSRGAAELFVQRLASGDDAGRPFAAVAGWEPRMFTVHDGGGPSRVRGPWVTDSFFDVLGVTPALGRTFAPGEDEPGSADVVVLSHGFWLRRFGGDPSVLGRRIGVERQDRTIIGVMPEDFQFVQANAELALPMGVGPDEPRYRSEELKLVGRLRAGVTLEQANAELDRILAQIRTDYSAPPEWGRAARVVSFRSFLVGGIEPTVLLLVGAVGLLLLLSLANLAGLTVTRALDRRPELALRAALGADRPTLTRFVSVEATLLGLLGLAPGLLLAHAGLRAIPTLMAEVPIMPWELPRLHGVSVTGATVAFASVLAIGGCLLASLAPTAFRRTGAGPRALVLRPKRARFRSVSVVGQVALTVLLMTGAGLLVRGFQRLTAIDAGFEPRGLLSFWHQPPGFGSAEEYLAYFDELEVALARVPEVVGVAAANDQPFFSLSGATVVYRVGPEVETSAQGTWRSVTPSFFETMGTQVVRGRGLSTEDGPGTPAVGVITQTAARSLFGAEDPLGQELRAPIELGATFTVVGIVEDVRSAALDRDSPVGVYRPEAQTTASRLRFDTWGRMMLVRVGGSPMVTQTAVVDAARAFDPDALVWDVRTVTARWDDSLMRRRVPMVVLSVFAVAALALGTIGIYGLLSYWVHAARREIGVRMAVGASHTQVVRHVARRAAALVVPGAVLGALGGAAASDMIAGFVFGATGADSVVLGGAVGLVLLASAVATLLPARRGARLDPVRALSAD